MASAYDKASLVMLPHAVKEDKLYSVKPEDRSGDFTFSRGFDIEATRVNSSGLIEKAKVNEIINSVWAGVGSNVAPTSFTITSFASGTFDAGSQANSIRFTAPTSADRIMVKQSPSITGVVTSSVYVEQIHSGTISVADVVARAGGSTSLITHLENGVPVASSHTISAGNTYSLVLNVTTACEYRYGIGTSGPIAGDITISKPQINHGLIAQDYVETTTTAVVEGLTADLPRLDYSGGASCPSLLLEPSRTNKVASSEYFQSGWTFVGVTKTENYGVSPEGVQNSTRIQFAGENNYMNLPSGGGVGFESCSVYMKGTSGETIKFGKGSNVAQSDFHTLTGEWQRLEFVGEDRGSALHISTYGGATARDIEIYGMQLEDGSYPTSYIPTYGTAANRGDDRAVISGANATAIIDKPAMTLYAEYVHDTENTNTTILSNLRKSSSGAYGDFISFIMRNNSQFQIEVRSNNTAQGTIQSSAVGNGTHKVAAVVANDNLKLFVDGVLVGSDTSVTLPTGLNEIYLGGYPDTDVRFGTKKSYLYFPTALTDAECIALTTI